MCVARNPYSQTNALLLEVEGNLFDAATVLQDNTILTPRNETLLKEEDECDQEPSSYSSLWSVISLFIFICVIPFALNALHHQSKIQEEDIKAIHMSMQRIQALSERHIRSLADFEKHTQEIKNDF